MRQESFLSGREDISAEKCFRCLHLLYRLQSGLHWQLKAEEKGKLLCNRGKSTELEPGWEDLDAREETEKDACSNSM